MARIHISALIISAALVLTASLGITQVEGPMVEAKFLGFHSYPTLTRLVFDTGGVPPDKFRYSYRQEEKKIIMAPVDGMLAFSFAPVSQVDEAVREIDFMEDDSGRRGIVIGLGSRAQGLRASYLKQPERVVIDISKSGSPGPIMPPGRPVKTVALDPGHGGRSMGSGGGSRLAEKDVALDISLRLKGMLERMGYKIFLSRYEEKELTPEERAGAANGAKADLYIAVHAGGSFSGAGGAAFFVPGPGELDNAASPRGPAMWSDQQAPYLPESLRLANLLSASIGKIYGKNPGVRDLRLSGMDGLAMPAVMVEVGDLDDPTQAESLSEDSFRNRIAERLAGGIQRFNEGKE